MPRTFVRLVPAVALLAAGIAWVMPRASGQAPAAANPPGFVAGQPSTARGEWPMYTADTRGSKYSPLDQINAANFNKLEIAWRFKTDSLGPRPEQKLQGAPLMVNGRLYTTGGTRKSVVSLDAKTGELLWVYRLDEGPRATVWAPRQYSGRGVSYWTDGKGDERIMFVTIGYQLVQLNARTGQPIQSFGNNGIVDLKVGVVVGKDKQVDLEKGEIGLHATPLVVNNMVIVGSSMYEGLGYMYSTNVKGLVRAFDVRTGKQAWRFNTIPGPGEFGNDTWENGSWEWTGNNGVWAQITADPELNTVYLPVETPTIDEYGGNRPGNNLFAESLVAVDLTTGKRKWHFQLVHHPLWDHDISSAPLLIDATIDGKARKLVGQPGKQGWLYTFDRITGEPIWPIPEVAVPQTDVPGEKTSPTQPIPTKPPPYSRTFVSMNDIIDFTPALRAQALENLKRYRWEQSPYVAPAYIRPGGPLGSINIGNTGGGVNWPGASFDPETGIFYAQANNTNVTASGYDDEELAILHPDVQAKNRQLFYEANPNGRGRGRGGEAAAGRGRGAPEAAPGGGRAGAPAGGRAGAPAARGGAGRGAEAAAGRGGRGAAPAPAVGGGGRGAMTAGLEGLPIVKPPYGVISAIDLNTGTLKFQVPHGDTPDAYRATFERLGIKYPEKTGQSGSVPIMVTKTVVVSGDPQVTAPPGRPAGAMLRAYDKQTGKEVGAVVMPQRIGGGPMTYMIDGRQYIVVSVYGAGVNGGEYVAYALPESEIRPNTQP
jgi:quinoprotein glucose dehydrogenase